MSSITAEFVKALKTVPKCTQGLYRLSDSVEFPPGEGGVFRTNYVVVSAATPKKGRMETFIFPANENGKILDWVQLPGSIEGILSWREAIKAAGWELGENSVDLDCPTEWVDDARKRAAHFSGQAAAVAPAGGGQ